MPAPAPSPYQVLRGHRSDVQCLAFQSNTTLLSGDADGVVKCWNLVDQREVWSRRLHAPNAGVIGVQALAWPTPALLSQGRDGVVNCWQLLEDGSPSSDPIVSIQTGTYNFCSASVCRIPDATTTPAPASGTNLMAVAGSEPADIDIYDLRTGQLCSYLRQTDHGMCMALTLLPAPTSPPPAAAPKPKKAGGALSAAFAGREASSETSTSSGSSLQAVAGYEDGTVALWDTRRADCPLASARLHEEPIMCLAVHPQHHMGMCGSADSHVALFALDLAAGAMREQKQLPLPAAGTGAVCFRPDGRICASGGWDGKVRVFHCKRNEPLALLKYHRGHVTSLSYSADSRLLASGSRDSNIAVWDVYPPKQQQEQL